MRVLENTPLAGSTNRIWPFVKMQIETDQLAEVLGLF
jgi:hypothetical protein